MPSFTAPLATQDHVVSSDVPLCLWSCHFLHAEGSSHFMAYTKLLFILQHPAQTTHQKIRFPWAPTFCGLTFSYQEGPSRVLRIEQ